MDLRGKTRLLIGDQVPEAVLPDNTPLQMLCNREHPELEQHFQYLNSMLSFGFGGGFLEFFHSFPLTE